MYLAYVNKVYADSTLPAVNFSLHNGYGLALAGAQVDLYMQVKDPLFASDTLLQNFGLTKNKNLTIHLIRARRWLGIKTNQWFYLHVFRAIRRTENLQAVISRDPGALPYLARLHDRKKIPVFYQPHNYYLDLSRRPDINPKNAQKYHLIEKTFLFKMDGILCLQKEQAALYRQDLSANVFCTPAGMLAYKSTPSRNNTQIQLVYIGSLQHKKGIDIILQACARVQKCKFELVLIGGRNEAEIRNARARVDKLNLQHRVTSTGWIPYREVQGYLRSADLGIIPLQDTFYNRYLTAPNKLFDYFSHGIPVIASDLPSIRSFVSESDGCLFFEPGNVDDCAQKIELFVSDASYQKELRRRVTQSAPRFLWQRQAERMLRCIDECRVRSR
ncbi:MAG: glycosyltransferase [Chitinivibrionales bacterium]|nr:glycosyltransferase [Chitinivibrionales bacterium]